eukprot:TRINITY_DN15514_c2_g1_i1.p1 TRINITY_DN15514_c2_g1~~TRINITY_DN15514_c2_g1_i1.p1  ORF type:complete len:328 (+),score=71.47 TRINITY_DN15514_c2_g1_i1:120-986(+)
MSSATRVPTAANARENYNYTPGHSSYLDIRGASARQISQSSSRASGYTSIQDRSTNATKSAKSMTQTAATTAEATKATSALAATKTKVKDKATATSSASTSRPGTPATATTTTTTTAATMTTNIARTPSAAASVSATAARKNAGDGPAMVTGQKSPHVNRATSATLFTAGGHHQHQQLPQQQQRQQEQQNLQLTPSKIKGGRHALTGSAGNDPVSGVAISSSNSALGAVTSLQPAHSSGSRWQCSACTLFNSSGSMECEACGTRKSQKKESCWQRSFQSSNTVIDLDD